MEFISVIIPIHIKMKNKLFFINYKLWFWIGCKYWFFREYNNQRDESLKKTKQTLEDAFTPQLRKLIEDGYCEECGYFNGEDKDV